jgi:HK97 family phage prohead protease
MTFAMATEHVDRMGDVIKMSGAQLDEFKKNPIALYGHNHEKPIGVWENVRIVGKQLLGDLKLAAKGTSAEIDTIRKLVEQRILRAVSVGFIPHEAKPIKKTGGYTFNKWSLNECSLVAVPANPEALAIAKSFGADRTKLFDMREQWMDKIEKSIDRIDRRLTP